MNTISDIPYNIGNWEASSLGNHRAVVEVRTPAAAVRVHLPWRRRDPRPEQKNIIIIDATTSKRVDNLARIDINREYGELVFQPTTAPGSYYIYFSPFSGETAACYPQISYPVPEDTADPVWLQRVQDTLASWPPAEVLAFESISAMDQFSPMELIASSEETKALLAEYPAATYLLFPEDRAHPIRLRHDLPHRWIRAGAERPFHGEAKRGEFYVFQLGLYAARRPVSEFDIQFSDLCSADGQTIIPGSAFCCFNLGGTDWTGRPFRKTVSVEKGQVQALWCGVQIPAQLQPGSYRGRISMVPKGLETRRVSLTLQVSTDSLPAAGDDQAWRHSRLRWLDSTIALDDELVAPFSPIKVQDNRYQILGRTITIGSNGLPSSIQSYFSPEMTHLIGQGREILARPVSLIIEDTDGNKLPWESQSMQRTKHAAGAAVWQVSSTAGSLAVQLHAQLEFDGNLEYTVEIQAQQETAVKDIRLEIPFVSQVAQYMMGLGCQGGRRPDKFQWHWDVKHNQDSAWIGDVNAGLQFTLKDENYSRPLNTNFYHLKPLVLPQSWHNNGHGAIQLAEDKDAFLITCSSGQRTIPAGQSLHFNFRLLLTPFKPIDTQAQWSERYYHRCEPLDKIAAAGANVVNVHHATEINPYINYPFLRPEAMQAYLDKAHQRDMRVKIYYTVRELTNRAPELFALLSLGDEILSDGPGGGHPWLQEHLVSNYIAGWRAYEMDDIAIINSGASRWHNYYLEGLDWLARNVNIDGLYIDDAAFGRVVMQRVRKILDRRRDGALIDLHSANQYKQRDGFANSANLYLEHFPYLNRIWFGEYFDYDAQPDHWLVEMSGIPFGLMGEMLQDGGNPWRGMLYGMTARLPWAGDPRPLWQAWDDFGIQDSQMIGYWAPSCPVRTNHPAVLATVYLRPERALVSLASWASEPVSVQLEIDWDTLGLDPGKVRLVAPAIADFQPQAVFSPGDEIPVEPGQGCLIIIQNRREI